MALFFGYKRLATIDDWRGLAGVEHWVAAHSAYELAHAWQPAGGLPKGIHDVIETAGHDVLKGLTADLCLVEKPVFLDTYRAPSMTDAMVYARNGDDQRVIVAVEAKAKEVFALRVAAWVRGDRSDAPLTALPRASRKRRLAFLSKHLAVEIGAESTLRYQLLHRTVSGVLEAQLHGAAAALVLIHAFGPQGDDNWSDFADFVTALGGPPPKRSTVSGPFHLGEQKDLPTYFLWHEQ